MMVSGMGQVQPFSEKPVGLALYEMKGGEISNIMMQGGALLIPKFLKPALWRVHALHLLAQRCSC